jgi:hypothetical protein
MATVIFLAKIAAQFRACKPSATAPRSISPSRKRSRNRTAAVSPAIYSSPRSSSCSSSNSSRPPFPSINCTKQSTTKSNAAGRRKTTLDTSSPISTCGTAGKSDAFAPMRHRPMAFAAAQTFRLSSEMRSRDKSAVTESRASGSWKSLPGVARTIEKPRLARSSKHSPALIPAACPPCRKQEQRLAKRSAEKVDDSV